MLTLPRSGSSVRLKGVPLDCQDARYFEYSISDLALLYVDSTGDQEPPEATGVTVHSATPGRETSTGNPRLSRAVSWAPPLDACPGDPR